MRGRASLVALAALLLTAGTAAADPSDVYVDYATDGTIECTHSRGDLEGILTDASINEYGDPLTLTRLRIAVRRQLAAGCVRGGQAAPAAATTAEEEPAPPTTTGGATTTPQESAGSEASTATTTPEPRPETDAATEPDVTEPSTGSTIEPETTAPTEAQTVAAGPAAEDGDGGSGSAAVLVGFGALAVGLLAGGGWLARRALTRSP